MFLKRRKGNSEQEGGASPTTGSRAPVEESDSRTEKDLLENRNNGDHSDDKVDVARHTSDSLRPRWQQQHSRKENRVESPRSWLRMPTHQTDVCSLKFLEDEENRTSTEIVRDEMIASPVDKKVAHAQDETAHEVQPTGRKNANVVLPAESSEEERRCSGEQKKDGQKAHVAGEQIIDENKQQDDEHYSDDEAGDRRLYEEKEITKLELVKYPPLRPRPPEKEYHSCLFSSSEGQEADEAEAVDDVLEDVAGGHDHESGKGVLAGSGLESSSSSVLGDGGPRDVAFLSVPEEEHRNCITPMSFDHSIEHQKKEDDIDIDEDDGFDNVAVTNNEAATNSDYKRKNSQLLLHNTSGNVDLHLDQPRTSCFRSSSSSGDHRHDDDQQVLDERAGPLLKKHKGEPTATREVFSSSLFPPRFKVVRMSFTEGELEVPRLPEPHEIHPGYSEYDEVFDALRWAGVVDDYGLLEANGVLQIQEEVTSSSSRICTSGKTKKPRFECSLPMPPDGKNSSTNTSGTTRSSTSRGAGAPERRRVPSLGEPFRRAGALLIGYDSETWTVLQDFMRAVSKTSRNSINTKSVLVEQKSSSNIKSMKIHLEAKQAKDAEKLSDDWRRRRLQMCYDWSNSAFRHEILTEYVNVKEYSHSVVLFDTDTLLIKSAFLNDDSQYLSSSRAPPVSVLPKPLQSRLKMSEDFRASSATSTSGGFQGHQLLPCGIEQPMGLNHPNFFAQQYATGSSSGVMSFEGQPVCNAQHVSKGIACRGKKAADGFMCMFGVHVPPPYSRGEGQQQAWRYGLRAKTVRLRRVMNMNHKKKQNNNQVSGSTGRQAGGGSTTSSNIRVDQTEARLPSSSGAAEDEEMSAAREDVAQGVESTKNVQNYENTNEDDQDVDMVTGSSG
ncbi:unnamed protein product, partial [Amoebophrya sp. A25]|eukprot:GSA25T00025444001.1